MSTETADQSKERKKNDMLFRDLLAKATDAFSKSNLGGHETTTCTGITTRFERIGNKKELIMSVCKELEDEISEYFSDKDTPYYLGIRSVDICFVKNKDEYENGDTDSDRIDCEIWEKSSENEYEDKKK